MIFLWICEIEKADLHFTGSLKIKVKCKEIMMLKNLMFLHKQNKSSFLLCRIKDFELIIALLLLQRLQEDPPAGVSGAPSENNIMVWNAVIFG